MTYCGPVILSFLREKAATAFSVS